MEAHSSLTKAGHLLSVPIFKRDEEVQTNHQPERKINEIFMNSFNDLWSGVLFCMTNVHISFQLV